MAREITTDGVIVIDHEELRGADVVSLFSERDTYANWKRQADKRIAYLQAQLGAANRMIEFLTAGRDDPPITGLQKSEL